MLEYVAASAISASLSVRTASLSVDDDATDDVVADGGNDDVVDAFRAV